MSDIFVSYTSSDSQWAEWIATDLRALGHTPHIHQWEIGPGDDILAWMENHHAAADHVLCVVSEAYLKGSYSILERNAAIWPRPNSDTVGEFGVRSMFPPDPSGIWLDRGLSGPHSPLLPPVVGTAANSPTVSTVVSSAAKLIHDTVSRVIDCRKGRNFLRKARFVKNPAP
ncbi:MAG: toll/interleukin-1 receptor domain-containing protein [Rhodopila sp.]